VEDYDESEMIFWQAFRALRDGKTALFIALETALLEKMREFESLFKPDAPPAPPKMTAEKLREKMSLTVCGEEELEIKWDGWLVASFRRMDSGHFRLYRANGVGAKELIPI
jgi:hypothetical protein